MGSQSIEIFRQGIWASVTGGWYHDPHQKIFCNTFHLYLWLYLSCVPFCIYLCTNSWWTVWIVHLVILTVISGLIKFANYVLRNMFVEDHTHEEEVTTEQPSGVPEPSETPRQRMVYMPPESRSLSSMAGQVATGQYEELAMEIVNRIGVETTTPPVDCSSRNSIMETDGSTLPCAASSLIDLKVDVHHKNSSGSDDGPIATRKLPKPVRDAAANFYDTRTVIPPHIQNWLDTMETHRPSSNKKTEQEGLTPSPLEPLQKKAHSSTDFTERPPKNKQPLASQATPDNPEKAVESFEEERCSSAPDARTDNYASKGARPKKPSKKSKSSRTKEQHLERNLTQNEHKSHSSKSKIKQSDIDTDEDAVIKDPSSPLLSRSPRKTDGAKATAGSSRKTRPSRSTTYHPLIQKPTKEITTPPTTTDIDGFRVTTLTFENIYADEESSSENASPLKVSSDEGEQRCLQVAIAGVEINPPAEKKTEDSVAQLSDRSNASSPEIDWLFSHSESDSEFANVPAEMPPPEEDPGGAQAEANPQGTPESERANLRDPEGLYKQGAIPKHRRQGVIISGPEQSPVCPSSTEEETMDLLRKMIDVFSKYPENHPKDFKKFLVLVSLEQDKRGNDSSVSDKATIQSITGVDENAPIPSSSSGAIPKTTRSSRSLQRKPALRRRLPVRTPARPNVDSKSNSESPNKCQGATAYFDQSDDSSPECPGAEAKSPKITSSFEDLPAVESPQDPNVHFAENHNDTTDGAVHCFQDEHGKWFTYTFNNGSSSATSITPLEGRSPLKRLLLETVAASGGSEPPSDKLNDDLAKECLSADGSAASTCSGMTAVLDNPAPQPSTSRWSPPTRDDLVPTPPPRRGSPVPFSLFSSGTMWNLRERGLAAQRARDETPRHAAPSSAFLDSLPSELQPDFDALNLRTQINPLQLFTNAFLERRRRQRTTQYALPLSTALAPCTSRSFEDGQFFRLASKLQPRVKTVKYHNLKIFNKTRWRVRFDRMALLNLIDWNTTIVENVFSVLFVLLVGILGGLVLSKGYYKEQGVFFFCWAMSSCQYSLFKSVQPDAASPTHGFNHLIIYSRPAYFCLCCSLVLLLDVALSSSSLPSFVLYGVTLTSPQYLFVAREGLLYFIAFFPVVFSLGLLPQTDTFFMYLLEQIDMHVFGGNAMTSLQSSIYCVSRSIITVLLLYGFVYGAMNQPSGSQHILYSLFCGLLVASSYHLSRSASSPSVVWQLINKHLWPEEWRDKEEKEKELNDNTSDPLPNKLRQTVLNRFMHDSLVCSLLGGVVFGVHASGVFTVLLQGNSLPENVSKLPLLTVWILTFIVGIINHYVIPQLRTNQPCMCWAHPACRTNEFDHFEVYDAAKVMWFEKAYIWLCILEKNVLYLILMLSVVTMDAPAIMAKHPIIGYLMIVVCAMKCLRGIYSQPQFQYLILAFTVLFFNWDTRGISETFLVDYFFMNFIFSRLYELLLKMKFIVTYIAPWQITWGSAFHAFAQPFSVPHSAMLFMQAIISAVLSTPLNPVLGSAIFITSYVRPIKFWERDYNTKRMDHSNTRLSSLLEHSPVADDNNLNSIFYEHLTRSLQDSLCGDLLMGHWGSTAQGDCFVLASDNLNCLVHIIEIGNGLVTFQVRGLEFRGTYCQQREVEAISEGVEDDTGCCCCEPGHLPYMLSANAAFNQRWLAWEVTATKYVLEGYSISDNSAASMFQMFELRKILITYYVKSIIYYVIDSPKLLEWIQSEQIQQAIKSMHEPSFVELDPTFHGKIDEDYNPLESGITRASFCGAYYDWLAFCLKTKQISAEERKIIALAKDAPIVTLCFALSLLGRRALGPSSQCENVDVFLSYLHTLFKGDIRPTSTRDEWIFSDMELLRKVVAPALRMSLKLHQDHFLVPGEYEMNEALHDAITSHRDRLVICHENDPVWRSSVLAGKPSLLSLRHVNDDGEDKFKIIMLNKRHLLFRVIKVNKECVRGLWAGQQQELIYLRNRNPERGSIQNAKQALRNIINSSCDQPIGYPIYVSPLTTSYADTHVNYSRLTGGTLTPNNIKVSALRACNRLKQRCVEGCSSGSSGLNDECPPRPHDPFPGDTELRQVLSTFPLNMFPRQSASRNMTPEMHAMLLVQYRQRNRAGTAFCRPVPPYPLSTPNSMTKLGSLTRIPEEVSDTAVERASSLGRNSQEQASVSDVALSDNMSSDTLKGLSLGEAMAVLDAAFGSDGRNNKSFVTQRPAIAEYPSPRSSQMEEGDSKSPFKHLYVRIIDANLVYDRMNLGRKIDVVWPSEELRLNGGQNAWGKWFPVDNMEGIVIHSWTPHHSNPMFRSTVDKTILLVDIQGYYVPIAKAGVQLLWGPDSSE